eukprot:12342305-Karenia_brevis.AAC.1
MADQSRCFHPSLSLQMCNQRPMNAATRMRTSIEDFAEGQVSGVEGFTPTGYEHGCSTYKNGLTPLRLTTAESDTREKFGQGHPKITSVAQRLLVSPHSTLCAASQMGYESSFQ